MRRSLYFIILTLLVTSLSAEKYNYVIINSGKLNLRAEPSKKAKVVGKLNKAQKIEILSKEGEDDLSYEWAKIKAGKKIGYISKEYISKYKPSELDESILLGELRGTSKDKSGFIRPIAYYLKGKWEGAATLAPEINYILNSSIQKKKSYSILGKGGKKVETVQIKENKSAGCQEYRVGGVDLQNKIFKENEKEVYFSLPNNYSTEYLSVKDKLNSKVKEELFNKAIEIIKAKNSELDIKSLKLDSGYIVKDVDADEEYSIARFVVKQDYNELQNVAFIAKTNKSKVDEILFYKHQILSIDQAPYGGDFHFMGSIKNKKEGIIIIFHHNGFDGFINELYNIKKGKVLPIVSGGGDAC